MTILNPAMSVYDRIKGNVGTLEAANLSTGCPQACYPTCACQCACEASSAIVEIW